MAEDKYQMPILEHSIDMIAEKLDKNEGEAWYSSEVMTYSSVCMYLIIKNGDCDRGEMSKQFVNKYQ